MLYCSPSEAAEKASQWEPGRNENRTPATYFDYPLSVRVADNDDDAPSVDDGNDEWEIQMENWSYQPIKLLIYISPVVVALIISPLVVMLIVIVSLRISKVNRARAFQAKKEQLYLRTVVTFALAIKARDQTTYGHSLRVRIYASGLAKLSGITDAQVLKAIEFGSLLHDIGKVGTEDYILNKTSRLSDQELEKMKLHATAGEEVLSRVRFPYPVAQYVRWHHERWDGTGYPDGLRGEQIPTGARIISIAEGFDTMRSTCPYKHSLGFEDSVRLLREQAGKGYDPGLVELFVSHGAELETAARRSVADHEKYFFGQALPTVTKHRGKAEQSPQP